MHIWGASPPVWAHWSNTLGLTEHLLPVVSNPAATISPDSKMLGLGKTPSEYNFRRQVRGLTGWTTEYASAQQVSRWAQEPDYGICVQARAVRAIDIDVENPRRAQRIVTHIERTLPWHLFPARSRPDSGKVLLPFLLPVPMTKRVIPVEGGIIEFLGDGQQWIAAGTHSAGQRYSWGEELPRAFPVLDVDDLDTLWEALCTAFLKAGEQPRIAREKRDIKDMDLPVVDDPVANWLIANWEVHDHGNAGELYCACPFAADHTTETGITSTAYFPAGTGGYEQGHWVCLHAHCTGRSDSDFNDATGYIRSLFPDLTSAGDDASDDVCGESLGAEGDGSLPVVGEQRQWPRYVRTADRTAILPTHSNLLLALERDDQCGKYLAYDTFRDQIVWAPPKAPNEDFEWKEFRDPDYVDLRVALERKGFRPFAKDALKDCVRRVADGRRVDIAQEWLSRLKWDGVPRVDRFMADYIGTSKGDYAVAVSRYLWTALAGRVMDPGCQADMAVVLVGTQGARKTSAIQALAPHPAMYGSINLHRIGDDNTARQMRGKLVLELEELRGLRSREAEEIKAWVSRREERWIPKYMEFEVPFARRNVMIGSTNDDDFLSDATGERRWLPIRAAAEGVVWGEAYQVGEKTIPAGWRCDVDAVARDRLQLWAEGAEMWANGGVRWQDAERLAKGEHDNFSYDDPWAPLVLHYMETAQATDSDGLAPQERGAAIGEVLMGAVGVSAKDFDAAKRRRVGSLLQTLGFVRKQFRSGEGREWRYVREKMRG